MISAETIKAEAARIGFAACGIARADAAPQSGARLRAWLADGMHGDMIWMEERAHQRSAPAGLWPEVRSVIALGMSYAPATDPLRLAAETDIGRVSVYAQGGDYHDLIKRRLKELARWIVARSTCDLKVFVDTAPVMEKPLAEAAGLGWQGKHTNLVSRDHGSWLFLGVIFTTLDLPADVAGTQRCGSCNACQLACPTAAFPAPYRLDARRCVSYLTIEHKGAIPPDLRAGIGNRIYGCDDCLAVCPWNKFASDAAANLAFAPRAELSAPYLADLLKLDDPGFRTMFSGSPIKRIGRDRMMRNCLIAAGNSRSADLVGAVTPHLDDANPVVRGAAIWALSQIDRSSFEQQRDSRELQEADLGVRQEWRYSAALASSSSL